MKYHDTIAAIATPIGSGGIAILRLSGPEAETIAARVLTLKNKKPLSAMKSHVLALALVHTKEEKQPLDEALVAIMRAPRSYTGETVVEIQCHGGYFAAQRILEELLLCGARLAEGGEFTRRAFLNGKTDLTAAEATCDIIDAHSSLGLGNAARALSGGLEEKINALREAVIAVTSHISAAADYPEEVDAPETEALADHFENLMAQMHELLSTFDAGRMMKDGIVTAIVGRPNVGKSSLLNALSGSNRAIVTNIPGTTRDVIEEYVHLGGMALRLLDTAGIRAEKDADEVERIGMHRTMDSAMEADLCLMLLDASAPIHPEDVALFDQIKEKQTLILLNKSDLALSVSKEEAQKAFQVPLENILITATPENQLPMGLDLLEETIRSRFLSGHIQQGQVCLSNTRQRDSLLKARDAVARALEGLRNDMPYDLLYIDLEDALSSLGEITGVTVQEEIIDQVFARFCVGK